MAVDALGNPLRVILSAGQVADIEQAEALIKDQPAELIVADKGYDSDAFVATIIAQDGQPVTVRVKIVVARIMRPTVDADGLPNSP